MKTKEENDDGDEEEQMTMTEMIYHDTYGQHHDHRDAFYHVTSGERAGKSNKVTRKVEGRGGGGGGKDVVVCWLLNVLATFYGISGTDLHRQFDVLPH